MLFFAGLVIMVVISVITYRLAVSLSLYKSAKDPTSSLAKNGKVDINSQHFFRKFI